MNITIDPTKSYRDAEDDYLLELCGIVPEWIEQIPETSNIIQGLQARYGFGNLFEMNGFTMLKDGSLHYPEDPALYPLIKFDRLYETVYQYNFGIVAIVYKDERPTFITRMD